MKSQREGAGSEGSLQGALRSREPLLLPPPWPSMKPAPEWVAMPRSGSFIHSFIHHTADPPEADTVKAQRPLPTVRPQGVPRKVSASVHTDQELRLQLS